MKVARLLSMSVMSSFLGLTIMISPPTHLFAQEHQDEAKPDQQEARPEPSKPETKAPDARPGESKPAEQTEDRPAVQDKARQDSDKNAAQGQDNRAQGDRANMQRDQNTKRAGNRIPDDKFRSNFGRQHTFVVQRPVMVGGRPQFQYGGYSFTIVDAWPTGWGYTDQCYIDYIDGEYFLFDLAHPGVRIAVMVVS